MALVGTLAAQPGEVAGQLDVLAHREKRQQVELLEDVAGVIDPEVIAGTGGQLTQVGAEQSNTAACRFLHAAEQTEQGGFAAAAGALEKQGFAALQAELRNIQQLGLAGPGKAQVGQFNQCAHGLRGLVRSGMLPARG